MKIKNVSVLLVAVIIAFATLLFLYSNKLGAESVAATKIFGGNAGTVLIQTEDSSSVDRPDDDSDRNDSEIDPDMAVKPRRNNPSKPEIGVRKPRGRFPVKPDKPKNK